jgi:twinkle protein
VSVSEGAPPPGAKNYASKFSYLEGSPDVIEWVIAVDADEPGRCLEEELARRFGVEKCRRVVWPEGCKDANDVLVKHGKMVLAECIEHAQPFPVAGVFSIDDIRDQVNDLYHNGMEPGLLAGLGELDRLFSVRPGEVTVITGIPNSGKSEFIEYFVVRLAGIHGWRFALFSPEHQPMHMHASRIIEKFLRKPFFTNIEGHMDEACLRDALEFAQDSFFWIQPPNVEDWTLATILEKAAALVVRHGIRGLIIDPFNELESLRPERQTETEYIGECLKRIRQFALSRRVHVFVVAHPQKLYRNKDGNYPIPSMYDISGSAHWRNKADNGLCVWRDLAGGEFVEIHVQKVRFKHTGRVGTAQLRFDRATGTYEAA